MIDLDSFAETLATLFCAEQLRKSLCSDLCATDPNHPHIRTGTNLMTVSEAQEMFIKIIGKINVSLSVQMKITPVEEPNDDQLVIDFPR